MEPCEISEMIRDDWIEIAVEDDIHGFNSHRIAIALEDVVDSPG
jgi:hypothetical protein